MRTVKPTLGILISLLAFVVAGCGDNRRPEDVRLDPAALAVDVGEDVTITALQGDAVAT